MHRPLVALLCVALFAASCFGGSNDVLENTEVKRSIDLNSQFSRHVVDVTVSNVGSSGIKEYVVAVPEQQEAHLALFEAYSNGASLKTSKGAKGKEGFQLYNVQLAQEIAAKGTAKLQLKFVFSHTMTPFPSSISQAERQLVRYSDNHYFSSPYKTKSQTTEVKLPTPSIESKSELAPTSVKGNTITYGPYSDVSPFSVSEMSLHFENNRPFITVTKMEKLIEISHWGNVAVEETYTLQHDGATLKGAFSRYDYQRSRGQAPAHISQFIQLLPRDASDVYYRDEIGNISTSHLATTEKDVKLELLPRFPLFGGWKFGFYMGYNLPLSSYLFVDEEDSSKYMLNVTFSTGIQDALIDDLTIRIILPERTRDGNVHVPFPIDGEGVETHFTYLDTSGRPVLLIHKKNVVPEHNKYFQVTYNFSKMSMLFEPLLLIVSLLVFFTFIMFYVRLQFRVGPAKEEYNLSPRAEEILARFAAIMAQRADFHSTLDSALTKAVTSKTQQVYQTEKQRVESGLHNLAKEMKKLLGELEELDGAVARKVAAAEALEQKKTSNQTQLHELEMAALRNPSQRQKLEENRGEYERGFTRAESELQNLVLDLTEDL